MAIRGNLFVVSGPAGAGKSEIVKTVIRQHEDVKVSVSCTTRKPREGEIPDVSYHFVDDKKFDELIQEDAFYEWAHVHQNRYGTLKSAVADELDKGFDVILEIDVQGCMQVMEQNKDATGVFVCPPSAANLEKRLRDRGTENEESLRVRLGNVAGEIEKAYNYDYVIIHKDWADEPNALQIAANELYAIITAKRVEKNNRVAFLDTITKELRK